MKKVTSLNKNPASKELEATIDPSTKAPRPASWEEYPYGSEELTADPLFRTVTLCTYGDLVVMAAPVA